MALKAKYFVLACWLIGWGAQGQIRRVIDFRNDASNPSFSVDGKVVYERAGQIVLAGTSPAGDVILTRGSSPEWHPSKRYFVFATQGRIVFMDPATRRILDSFPGGQARDLRFSRDGMNLAWMDGSVARIRLKAHQVELPVPGGLAVTGVDDFSADGTELVVTASHGGRQSEIYACGIAKAACRALTENPKQRQDFARLAPSGLKIVYASSETAWVPDAPIDYESDLWLTGVAAGSKALRMTWFNEPANPRYDPAKACMRTSSWSRDGRFLLATITEGPQQDHSRLVKIEFPEPE